MKGTPLKLGWILWAPAAASLFLALSQWRQGNLRGRRLLGVLVVWLLAALAQRARPNTGLWFVGFTAQIVLAGVLALGPRTTR